MNEKIRVHKLHMFYMNIIVIKMKTRSGVMRMPPHWPSLYQARELIPELKNLRHFEKIFTRLFNVAVSTKSWYGRCFLTLIISEMILRYQIFLDTIQGQYILDKIIKSLSTAATLKEYTQQFKVLSDSHRLLAKRTYIEFIFKTSLCIDVAQYITNFVV
jgi:hypothetical protein